MGVETGDGPPGLGMERVAADTRTVPGQLSPQVRRDINDRIKTAAPSPRSALIMVATGDGPPGLGMERVAADTRTVPGDESRHRELAKGQLSCVGYCSQRGW